ncbi:MAG: DUF4376 domain-containing protein [Haemophilus parainfluenzae]|nr:DUF4376 domain-containing protein [Haemophilus parainfluenzae]
MQYIKKFTPYNPEVKPFGESAIYLKDENGLDWYESQAQFSANTLKVMFDDNGLIISSSRDVSSLFPLDCGVLEIDTEENNLDGSYVINGKLVKIPKPSEFHQWNGVEWFIPAEKKAELIRKQKDDIRAKINAKRDACVNGGVFVPAINKWVDTDDKGRSTLVEIKADFDLNGKDNTYTLICADNTAQVIHFEEFKEVWNAAKTLKEKMYENAYMHKLLLEQSANPKDYNWSSGWSKTYQEHLEGK